MIYLSEQEQINQMYAQIVYKDKNLLDLNNKILEQERKMIDIQELVGEKNEVIRGRDKVIEVNSQTCVNQVYSIRSSRYIVISDNACNANVISVYSP